MAERGLEPATVERISNLVAQLPTPQFVVLVEKSLEPHHGGGEDHQGAAIQAGTDLRYLNGSLANMETGVRAWFDREGYATAANNLGRRWPDGPGYLELGGLETDPEAIHRGVATLHGRLIGDDAAPGVVPQLEKGLREFGDDPRVSDALIALDHVRRGAEGAQANAATLARLNAADQQQPPAPPAQASRPGRISDAMSPRTTGQPHSAPPAPGWRNGGRPAQGRKP